MNLIFLACTPPLQKSLQNQHIEIAVKHAGSEMQLAKFKQTSLSFQNINECTLLQVQNCTKHSNHINNASGKHHPLINNKGCKWNDKHIQCKEGEDIL